MSTIPDPLRSDGHVDQQPDETGHHLGGNSLHRPGALPPAGWGRLATAVRRALSGLTDRLLRPADPSGHHGNGYGPADHQDAATERFSAASRSGPERLMHSVIRTSGRPKVASYCRS